MTVALGDLNGDGKADMVVGDAMQVCSFLGDGNGGFLKTPSRCDAGFAGVNQVAVADVNGDGRADVVVAHNGGVAVFTNATTPGSTTVSLTRTDLPTPPGALSVAAADLTGNGRPGLLVGFNGLNGPSAIAYMNQTSPGAPAVSFGPGMPLPITGAVPAVATFDVNGDGRADFVMANGLGILVALNTSPAGGPISFSSPMPFETSATSTPTSLAPGDLNGDGRADLVVAQNTGFAVLVNTTSPGGSPAFAVQVFTAPSGAKAAAVADLNGDGRADIAVSGDGGITAAANLTSQGALTVALGTPSQSAAPGSGNIAITDLNGDGKPDLIVLKPAEGTVQVCLNTTPSRGTPAQVWFTVGPADTTAGGVVSPGLQVTILDALGNPVTQAANAVTVALGTNPGGATLSGTTTVNAQNGIATFSNLSLDKASVGYTLAASSAGLVGATSGPFNVTPGAPSQLVITTQPSNTQAGNVITVQVAIQDAFGNTVTTANGPVTVQIGANPGNTVLFGTTTANAVNGVATFTNLWLDKAGTGYTLTLSSPGLAGVTTAPFNNAPGAASQLVITAEPNDATVGFPISVSVAIRDAYGNTVTNATNPVTLSLATNPGGATLSGTTSVNPVNGVATFTVSLDKAAPGYTFTASSSGLTGATSAPFTVSPPNLPPQVVKSFLGRDIPLNGSVFLVIKITNPNPSMAITGISFTDTLPQGLVVATPSQNQTFDACGGTAATGTFTVSLTGGSLAPGDHCAVLVTLTGIAPGKKTNEVTVSSSFGSSNTATATLAVVQPPTIIKSFGAQQIPQGGTTSLTFTIINNDLSTPLTNISFTDVLPVGMLISVPSGLTGSCGGGTITTKVVQDADAVVLSGAQLGPSSSCTFSVNVTATVVGTLVNTTSALTTNEGITGVAASASIRVVKPVQPPTIQKAFFVSFTPLNGQNLLILLITNPNSNLTLTGVGFTDNMPAGLVLSPLPTPSNDCNGTTLVRDLIANTISLSGATLDPGGSCLLKVGVRGASMGTKINTTSVVTSNEGGTGFPATASTVVLAPPVITKAFSAATIPLNGMASLTFTITNPAANPEALNVFFNDTLPAGMTVAPTPNATNSCGGTLKAAAGASSVGLSGGTLSPGVPCTISVKVQGTAVGLKTNSVSVSSINGGDGNVATASINVAKIPTATLITGASPNPSFVDGAVTFTARVIPDVRGNPTGTVTFKDGDTVLGTVPLNSTLGTASFTTSSLALGSHSITATYSGDDDFDGSASSASVQKVTYNIVVLTDQTAKNSGATIPIKIVLLGGNGQNLSSPNIVPHVTGVFDSSGNPAPGQISNANPNGDFRFDATLAPNGGGYIFNLKTTGFAPGTYEMHFTIPGDPVLHIVTFTVD